MSKTTKKWLHAAHLGSAIILGMAISGADKAPLGGLFILVLVTAALLLSYAKLYPTWPDFDEAPGDPETPIDNQVRRDLGIED